MCGILGVVGAGQSPDLDALLRSISHRGPDSRGSVSVDVGDRKVHLGHARLAILDLSPAGEQPMWSRDGRWCVVFNGEIYGHERVRADLEGPFRGHSDTETLVEALSAWGVEPTLARIDGMFAFAAYDRQTKRLFLARDPFGIKPLYVADLPKGGLAFASEARAIRLLAPERFDVSEEGLQTFLALRYVPSPGTLWRGVERVPPGHVVTVDVPTGKRQSVCFVKPTTDRFRGTLDDAAEAWRDVLGGAVRRQLLSDVPVGVLLSGGIDSAVVAAMARDAGADVPTFTVGFEGRHDECEIDDAAETAKVLGLKNDAVRISPDDMWTALDPVVESVEEPLGTTSILPMWYLVRRARQDVTVVLTGQGNDEPWGGYRRYQAELLRQRMPVPMRLAEVGAALANLPRIPEFVERGLRTLPEQDRVRRFRETYALFDPAERKSLLGTSKTGAADRAIDKWLTWAGDGGDADAMMRVDSRMNLADDLLLYGDKVAMSVALEARVPMLDLEAVRFVESLPVDYRVRVGRTKVVHKEMARTYLPRAIVERRKKGFRVPFGTWIRGPWKERVRHVLLEPGAPHLDRISRGGIAAIWNDHQSGRRDRERQIFALLTLAVWWKQQRL